MTDKEILTRREDELFYGEVYDMWEDLGLSCAGYNSEIDADVIAVCEHIISSFDESTPEPKPLDLDDKYVELIKYILCNAGLCDYGTSPRVCFSNRGKLEEFLEKVYQEQSTIREIRTEKGE